MAERGRKYYADQYRKYEGTPEQLDNRAQRNAARKKMMDAGVVHKGDGKDVHHRRDISAGGTNARSNLTVSTPAVNRATKGRKR